MALRETGERGPPVGCDRPVVPPVALPDALRRPRRNGVGGVSCVGMTVGAVERLVESVGGIVDFEDSFPLHRPPPAVRGGDKGGTPPGRRHGRHPRPGSRRGSRGSMEGEIAGGRFYST